MTVIARPAKRAILLVLLGIPAKVLLRPFVRPHRAEPGIGGHSAKGASVETRENPDIVVLGFAAFRRRQRERTSWVGGGGAYHSRQCRWLGTPMDGRDSHGPVHVESTMTNPANAKLPVASEYAFRMNALALSRARTSPTISVHLSGGQPARPVRTVPVAGRRRRPARRTVQTYPARVPPPDAPVSARSVRGRVRR